MRSCWIRVGPKFNITGVLIRSRHTRRKHHEMSAAGIGVMLPQAKEYPKLLRAGKGKKGFASGSSGKSMTLPTNTSYSDSNLQKCERINFISE